MPRPPSKACPICESRFGSSDCIHIGGEGTPDDPYVATPIHDPDDAQLMEDGPAGWALFAPPWLINPPACHMYATVNNTIAWNTAQGLFFNEIRYDTDSMCDTDASRITFKTAGVYLVTLNVRWKKVDVDEGDVAAFIRLNGGMFIAIDAMPIGDADLYTSHSLSVQKFFEAGDYIEAWVQTDGEKDGEPIAMLPVLSDYRLPSFAAIFLRPTPP